MFLQVHILQSTAEDALKGRNKGNEIIRMGAFYCFKEFISVNLALKCCQTTFQHIH
jgi:hypothetical protein